MKRAEVEIDAKASYLDIVPHDRTFETPNPAITYPFELDPFQKASQHYIQLGESILVTAHTSAGKTIPAECAIAFAKSRGRRAFYTSPIKTLSNQKYSEFLKKFGDVGLLTGDIKCNPDAQCVIMTTEILLDLLNRQTDLKDIDCVIFDEIHYINNPERGHVWEECLVKLPPHIQITGLSATISEAPRFARWIGELKHKPIHLISTLRRPVPLNHYAYANEQLHLILDHVGGFHEPNYREYTNAHQHTHKKGNVSLLNQFIHHLKVNKLAPAIFFVFSRKKCQVYANQVSVSLCDVHEQALITNQIDWCLAKHSIPKDMLDKIPQVNAIKHWASLGIGVHHSGLLPVLKEVVEILFAKGLLKVLFATETFAVGVNTPTKSVIFTELTKYCDGHDQPRLLRPDEYLQMSGRAGRRGLDRFGSVIHLPMSEVYDLSEVRTLLLGKSAKIESKFKVNYTFILQNPKDTTSSSTAQASYLAQQHQDTIQQLDRDIHACQHDLEQVQTQLQLIPHQDQLRPLIQQILDLELKLTDQLSQMGTLSIKMDKNQIKKHKQTLSQLTTQVGDSPQVMEIKNNLCRQQQLTSEIKGFQREMTEYQSVISAQDQACRDELQALGYLDEQGQPTQYGLMAAKINSANAILLTDLITSDYVRDLDLAGLASVLSLFADNSDRDDDPMPKGLPQSVTKSIDFLYETHEYYLQTYPCYQGAGLDLSSCLPAYLWAQGKSYFEILPQMEGYEGNFVRNMLRLSHICEELIKVCEISQDSQLEKKLQDLKLIIIRDPVNFDSLYLKL